METQLNIQYPFPSDRIPVLLRAAVCPAAETKSAKVTRVLYSLHSHRHTPCQWDYRGFRGILFSQYRSCLYYFILFLLPVALKYGQNGWAMISPWEKSYANHQHFSLDIPCLQISNHLLRMILSPYFTSYTEVNSK